MRNRDVQIKLCIDKDFEEYTHREIDYFDCGQKKLVVDTLHYKITSQLGQYHLLDNCYHITIFVDGWDTFYRLKTSFLADAIIHALKGNKDLIITKNIIESVYLEIDNMKMELMDLHHEEGERLGTDHIREVYGLIYLQEHTHKRKTPLPKEYSIAL